MSKNMKLHALEVILKKSGWKVRALKKKGRKLWTVPGLRAEGWIPVWGIRKALKSSGEEIVRLSMIYFMAMYGGHLPQVVATMKRLQTFAPRS